MVRMLLIYAALFAVSAAAIWMKPADTFVNDTSALDEIANVQVTSVSDVEVSRSHPISGPLLADLPRMQTAMSVTRPIPRPASLTQAGVARDSLWSQMDADLSGGRQAEGAVSDLIVSVLSQDASGAAIGQALASQNSVDVAPLLEIPGSIAGADGTRILASALLRQASPEARASLNGHVANVTDVSAQTRRPDIMSYKVRRGDTLRTIAAEIYGTQDAYRQIFEANRDKLKSVNAIKVGQRLRLP